MYSPIKNLDKSFHPYMNNSIIIHIKHITTQIKSPSNLYYFGYKNTSTPTSQKTTHKQTRIIP